MVDEATRDVLRRIESPTTTIVTRESQTALRSPGEVRETLAEHLRLMLEKPTVPWGTTLAWSEGGITHIPSYEGHVIRVADQNGQIGAMVISLAKGRGFTGEPTKDSCLWTRYQTRMSSDFYSGQAGKTEQVKPEDRQIITYIGELSGEYEVYQNQALGVWLIRAAYSAEKIGDEGVYKSGAYLAEKAAKYGLKKPEPGKPKVVWQMYRTPQMPKDRASEHGYLADPREQGAPHKSGKTTVPLPPPGSGWGRKTESSTAGTFRGGR